MVDEDHFPLDVVSLVNDAAGAISTYFVRDETGRLLGPLPGDFVANLLANGSLTGREKYRLADDEEGWRPAHDFPEFSGSLRLGLDAQTESVIFPPLEIWVLNSGGAASIFLEIARERWTGWLKVTRDTDVKLVAFRGGMPTQIRSNLDGERFGSVAVSSGKLTEDDIEEGIALARERGMTIGNALVDMDAISREEMQQLLLAQAQIRMADLFRWSVGEARFDEDQTASSLDDVFGMSTIELCRRYLSYLGKENIERWIGGPTIRLAPAENAPIPGSQEEILPRQGLKLSEVEEKVVRKVGLTSTLKDLVTSISDEEEFTVLRSVFVLLGASYLRRESAGKSEDLITFTRKLNRPNLLDALTLPEDPADNQIRLAFERLRKEAVSFVARAPPEDAYLLTKWLEATAERLDSPLEIYVLRRAKDMGVDPRETAVRDFVEAEYLNTRVNDALERKELAEALKHATKRAELLPQDAVAQAQLALAQLLTTSSAANRKKIAHTLIEKSQEFPNAVELQLLVARMCIEVERFPAAKRALALVEGVTPEDPRLLKLQKLLVERTHDVAPETTTISHKLEVVRQSASFSGNRAMRFLVAFGVLSNAYVWKDTILGASQTYEVQEGETLNKISPYLDVGYKGDNNTYFARLGPLWDTLPTVGTQQKALAELADELRVRGITTAIILNKDGKMISQVRDSKVVYIH